VTDPAKKVAANDNLLPFVTFPGNEIKDLYVHDVSSETAPAAAAETLPTPPAATKGASSSAGAGAKSGAAAPPHPPTHHQQQQHQQQHHQGGRGGDHQGRGGDQAGRGGRGPKPSPSAVGTGEHLLRMRLKKTEDGSREDSAKGNVV
jgi:hypothetical protein